MSKVQSSKINRVVGALLVGCMTLSVNYSAFAGDHKKALEAVVAERSVDTKKRDAFRHPVETLSFFQVKPGMAVAEALPGGGWYSNILANYLGKEGELYGVNYVDSMWARFGFFNEEAIAGRIASTKAFSGQVAEFTNNGIKTDGFTFDTIPSSLAGKLDRVLFVRALHNLSRFEDDAGTLTQALEAAHKMLKPDGMVGVVQHQIPESAPDEGAKGNRGYMKASRIKAAFKAAGFELVSSSDINKNPKDKPADNDIVWRLPPSFNGSRDDEDKRKAMEAIGESNRMTLLFKKV
jgi:predicted methyltransferase